MHTVVPCLYKCRTIVPCLYKCRTVVPCLYKCRTVVSCLYKCRTIVPCLYKCRTVVPCLYKCRTIVPYCSTILQYQVQNHSTMRNSPCGVLISEPNFKLWNVLPIDFFYNKYLISGFEIAAGCRQFQDLGGDFSFQNITQLWVIGEIGFCQDQNYGNLF